MHSVGGWIALVGAAISRSASWKIWKDGKSKAIPGHSLTIAALGVFILWFGWFDSTQAHSWQQQLRLTVLPYHTYSLQQTWRLVQVVYFHCY